MKNPHPTKKGPGRRAVTKADVTINVPTETGIKQVVKKVFGSWRPGAKIRKQIIKTVVGIKGRKS